MYFATDTIRIYKHIPWQDISQRQWSVSSSRNYFCILQSNGQLELYVSKNLIRVCSIQLDSVFVQQVSKIIWSQDDNCILIVCDKSATLLKLSPENNGDEQYGGGMNRYQFAFQTDETIDAGFNIASVKLALAGQYSLSHTIQDAAFLSPECVLVFLKDSQSILQLSTSDGLIRETNKDLFQDLVYHIDNTGSNLKSVHVDTLMDIAVLCLDDDSMFLYKVSSLLSPADKDAQYREFAHLSCRDVDDVDVVLKIKSIAFNAPFRLLTVLTSDGLLINYRVSGQLKTRQVNKIKCPSYESGGSTSAFSWTHDGYAMALSYAAGGLTVYSVFGKCIFSTITNRGEQFTFSNGNNNENQSVIMNNGNALFWDFMSYSLNIVSRADSQVVQMQFGKNSLTTCNVKDNMRNPFLISADSLHLYNHSDVDVKQNVEPVHPVSVYKVVLIPQQYIQLQGPVRYACANNDGSRIAVAGRRGFAIYQKSYNKWKLFVNEECENRYEVQGGLIWFKHYLIAGVFDHIQKEKALIVVDSRQSLDPSKVLISVPLQSQLIKLNILYNHLLVVDDELQVMHYVLEDAVASGNSFLQMRLLSEQSLNTLSTSPLCLQFIDWFLPITDYSNLNERIKDAPYIVLSGGDLSLVNPPYPQSIDSSESSQSCLIAQKIEFCWPFYPRKPIGTMFNALWAYDGHRVRIWINLLLQTSVDFRWAPRKPLELKLDFYPFGVLFHKGIIVGVEQSLTMQSNAGFNIGENLHALQFQSHGKTFLFIHYFVKSLLDQQFYQEALEFGAFFQDFEYFGHSMEIMLHKVVAQEFQMFSDNQVISPSTKNMLPRLIQYLQNFQQYRKIVVNCARKTEFTMWDYLFSVVGSPLQLFQQCLEAEEVQVAASCLIILQTQQPTAVTKELQISLLKKALNSNELELVGDIVRYLTRVNEL
ncbi:hypothetical protein MP228_006202 [Amoeboaphelidium protococcarum]|nr:hypothetical protein MP228_006202 [Amoeboaphelidium protococcarum]